MNVFSQLVTQLDDLCPLYWDLCIDHLYHLCFQQPENTEIQCSDVLFFFCQKNSDVVVDQMWILDGHCFLRL